MVNQSFGERVVLEYLAGSSANEIAAKSGISEHKVNYWLSKMKVKKRTISEAIYLRSNKGGDPFSIVTEPEVSDPLLYGLGVGIYVGEGEKVSKHNIRVANGDFRVILAFRRFLINLCRVNQNKIRHSLVCSSDLRVEVVEKYWLGKLKLKGKVFGKIVQVPSRGEGTYKRKLSYGVCTLTFSNVKLKSWMMEQIDKVMGRPG